jgi:hypothetical protein
LELLNLVKEIGEMRKKFEIIKEGMRVRFVEAIDEQVQWGKDNDDPRKYLKIGEVYTVLQVEPHKWHTKLYLKEFPDKKFNSVHFRKSE